MDTSTWGPKLWDCLFYCARDLDPAEVRAVLRLVRELIPCALCRASYRHWHRTYPLGEGNEPRPSPRSETSGANRPLRARARCSHGRLVGAVRPGESPRTGLSTRAANEPPNPEP